MTQAQNAQTNHSQTDVNQGSESRLGDPRAAASEYAAKATQTMETNPLGVLAGGLALGAIAGALLPRTEREREMLRPVGSRLGAVATAAIAAAREAGRSELENRGLTASSARDQAKTLFQNVAKAASGAATAAVKTAKQEATGKTDEPDSTGGTGDSVPAIDPHQQVMAGDRETSYAPTV
jgi:hypothetical protein